MIAGNIIQWNIYNGYQIALPWPENQRLTLHGRLSLNILSHLNLRNFYNIKQPQVPPDNYAQLQTLKLRLRSASKSERHSWGMNSTCCYSALVSQLKALKYTRIVIATVQPNTIITTTGSTQRGNVKPIKAIYCNLPVTMPASSLLWVKDVLHGRVGACGSNVTHMSH